MESLAKDLPCEHEEQSSDSQHTCKSRERWQVSMTLAPWEGITAETDKSVELIGQPV